MYAFASIDALEAGWRKLGNDEEQTAQTLLNRASASLVARLTRKGIVINTDDKIQMTNLETVCCNMVRRVLDNPGGVSQMSQGIGATNGSISFANPDSSLFLSRDDKLLLGLVGDNSVYFVQAHTYADEVGANG